MLTVSKSDTLKVRSPMVGERTVVGPQQSVGRVLGVPGHRQLAGLGREEVDGAAPGEQSSPAAQLRGEGRPERVAERRCGLGHYQVAGQHLEGRSGYT